MFVGASTKLSVALLLALSCATTVSAAALNMTNICLLVGNGYNVASQDSCSEYYYCSAGLATLQTCSPSMYFSKDAQGCVPAAQANCVADNSAPCASRTVGTWAPMAGSCSGYYYCSANGALAGYCPNGENFDATSQTCQYADVMGCTTPGGGSGDSVDGSGEVSVTISINLCSFIQNGVYFGSPSRCVGWNTCNNNIMTSGACSSGFVFNVHLRTCDYASDWGCSQVTNDPNLINTASPTGGPCSVQGNTTAATACNNYYLCNGATYQLTQCATGFYYDTPTGTCVNRLQARNDCDRCVGLTSDTFVNAYSSVNCTDYLYCQNGVQQSTGTCASGFFDEVAGACVLTSTDPAYACCNPDVDASGNTATTVAGGSNSTSTGNATLASGATTIAGAPATSAPTTAPTTVTTVKV